MALLGHERSDLPCSTLPHFLCGVASLAAGRGLGGASDVLSLVASGRRLSEAVEGRGFPSRAGLRTTVHAPNVGC